MAVDFVMKNGVVDFGYSDECHVEDVLINQKGWNKFSPQIGVGILAYRKSPHSYDVKRQLTRQIKVNVNADGGTVHVLAIDDELKIKVNATY